MKKERKGMDKKEGRRNERRKSEERVRGYKHFYSFVLFLPTSHVRSLFLFFYFAPTIPTNSQNDTMNSDTHSTTLTTNNADIMDTHDYLIPEATTTTETVAQLEGRVTNETLATVGPVAAELAQEFSIESLSAPAVKEAQGQIQTVALQMDGIRTQVGQVPPIRLSSGIPGLRRSTTRN